MGDLIVIGVSVGVILLITVGVPFLKKKGVNIEEDLKKADTIVNATDVAITAANALVPDNQVIHFLSNIKEYVQLAVHGAEQLCIASALAPDERNSKAKENIDAVLKTLGIEKTNELNTIINDTVEAVVLALGHKEPTETEIQSKVQELQTQLDTKIQENAQLTQTLSQVKSIMQ